MPALDDVRAELEARLGEALSVVVARRGGDGAVEAAKVALGDDAADGFRSLARDAISDLGQRTAVPYTADAELAADQAFVLDDPDTLAEVTDLGALADQAATLPITPPRDLDLRIQLYGVVLGDSARVSLVRRADPRIPHHGGRWLALGGERLTRLDDPVFSFSAGFDLVLGPGWVVVLDQAAFERLFREIGIVDRHVRTWVAAITDHLPMDADSEAALVRVAHDDSRTWRRLREIRRRGHLASVDLADVRRYAKRVGLDPETIVHDGRLVFHPAHRFSFLHLLNEDLYRGPLTDEPFEAQRKASAATP